MFATGYRTTFLGHFGHAKSKNDHHFIQSALVFAILQKTRFFRYAKIQTSFFFLFNQILQPKLTRSVAMDHN